MARAFTESDISDATAFAVLTLDGRHWLIPQNEIHSLETVLDMTADAAQLDAQEPVAPNPAGFLPFRGQLWPVYCLGGDFARLQNAPGNRRIVVLLNHDHLALGLMCDEIEVLGRDHGKLQALPACMGTATHPLRALLSHGEDLAYVTTTARLAALLGADTTGGRH
jgi:chemotaxis signal transduction protein